MADAARATRPTPSYRGYRVWLAFAAFLVAVALTIAVAANFIVRWSDSTRSTDFSVFFAAGAVAARGDFSDLYDYDATRSEQRQVDPTRDEPIPFTYPATVAAIFAPLSRLPFSAAYAVFLALNVAAVAAGAALLWRIASPAPRAQRALLLLFLGVAYGTVSTLRHGQLDILLTVMALSGFLLERGGMEGLSVLAVLPLALKPQSLPGVLLYWLHRRRWRALAVMAATVTLVYLWPLVVAPYAVSGLRDLYRGFFVGGDHQTTFRNGDLLRGLGHGVPGAIGSLAIGAAVLVIAWRDFGRRPTVSAGWQLVFLLPALLAPWGPREVFMAGLWALLIAERRFLQADLASVGMLLVAVSTVRVFVPELGAAAALAVLLLVTKTWPFRSTPKREPAVSALAEHVQVAAD